MQFHIVGFPVSVKLATQWKQTRVPVATGKRRKHSQEETPKKLAAFFMC